MTSVPDDNQSGPARRRVCKRTLMTGITPHTPRIRLPVRRAAGGFTLIEILVALVVVAVALGAIVTETGNYVGNAAHIRDRTIAHWVAMNQVAEQHIASEWPSTGNTHGTALMAEREWFWEMTVSDTEDADVRRIDVEVRAARDAEDPAASAIAYVGRSAQ